MPVPLFNKILNYALKQVDAPQSQSDAPAPMASNPALPLQFGSLKLYRCLYGWMLVDGPYIGKCFELYGEYSESEVSVLRRYLKPGDFAIDVGANIGDLTVPMAQFVGQQGRVFAIESNPETCNVLCANLSLNQIRNTRPINKFIADAPDVDTASPVWGPHAYTGDIWPPSFMALDDLRLPRCNLIKVDVDGRELEVLRSAKKIIETCEPVLYFENDVRERSFELLSFVLGLGYRLFAHAAPIFRQDNFFGNPVNAWDPNNICSLMVLALPARAEDLPRELFEILHPDFWWD